MTCKDCVHEKVCKNAYSFKVTPPNVCSFFKNKADVVEVVRCKDCKYLEKDEGLREGRMCLIRGKAGWCHDNDYCSYGERKEKDNG